MTDREAEPPKISLLIAIFSTVCALWLINFIWGAFYANPNSMGSFGDVFGASNALFSALALGGVIYAIFIQRSEVKIARAELNYTKSIFEEQSQNLKLQNAETKIQIFESTFFQLMRMFTDLTESLTARPRKPVQGKSVFDMYEKDLAYYDAVSGTPRTSHEVYSAFYADHESQLGHYFRILYTILKFVHAREVTDKKFYTNILRAQLSNGELHFLLYNGLSEYGHLKLKPLLEEYSFFDNLPLARIKYPSAVLEYDRGAFGENIDILRYLDHIVVPPVD